MALLPSCKDPTLTALKSQGYNVVQFPKADLRPSQLLSRKGSKLRRLGELTSVFVPGTRIPVPPISDNNPAPSISGSRSADLDASVGLSILGGLISALGGSTLGLNASYTRARSVQFEFGEVIENNVEPALIDQFLADASVSLFAVAVADMLDADDVYVLTSTLRSKRINVAAKDASKTSLGIDGPVVQQAVGANLKVTAAGASASVVSYEGAVPLVFGFQAIRLIFDDGKYRAMRTPEAGSISIESLRLGSGTDPRFAYLSLERAAGRGL